MSADREDLSVWRYLFSLRGRVSRRGVWLLVVLFEGLSIGMSVLLVYRMRSSAIPLSMSVVGLSAGVIGVMHLLTVRPRFAILFKQLHDIGRSGLFALAVLIIPLLGMVHGLWKYVSFERVGRVSLIGEQAFSYTSAGILAYYVILLLILGVVPAKTSQNGYAESEPVNASSVF